MNPNRQFLELTISFAGKVGRLEHFEGYFTSAKNTTEERSSSIFCFLAGKAKAEAQEEYVQLVESLKK